MNNTHPSTPLLPRTSFSGIGAFFWDFTNALFLYVSCLCHPLAQVLTLGFSLVPSILFSNGFGPFCGWFFGLDCMFLFTFAWCITSICDDGHSVSSHLCLADWRAIRPGHTQAAAKKKNSSADCMLFLDILSHHVARRSLQFAGLDCLVSMEKETFETEMVTVFTARATVDGN